MTGLLLPNITYLSCSLCHGTRKVFDDQPCNRCEDPDIARVRWMLPRLTVEQIDMIRFFEHTLAEQPMTQAESDGHLCEYFVEDEQTGEFDHEADDWLFPPQRHWFAGGRYSSGPCGNGGFFQFNATGLLLRECLMCAATAIVPHMHPPRSEAIEQTIIEASGERDGGRG